MRFTLIQYSNQFALGGWSWTVLTYRVQRKVLTSDLGQSYLLPTRAHDQLHKANWFEYCKRVNIMWRHMLAYMVHE